LPRKIKDGRRALKKIDPVAIVTAMLVLTLPASAAAHVTLQPNNAPAGQVVRLDVRVPNEKDDASTTKVDVRFPTGFVFASYEAVPGWKVSVRREKLDKPVTAEGEKFTEQISRMTWTGEGAQGKIGPGEFKDFGISVQIPDKSGTKLTFPSLQTYDNGDVVRWIGAEDADEPAPRVEVTAAAGGAQGAAEEPSGTTDAQEGATGDESAATEESGGTEGSGNGDGGGDDSNTLSIIALVVGGLGLVMGGFALTSARRRS
jgi:uncharacterized protein YcnI